MFIKKEKFREFEKRNLVYLEVAESDIEVRKTADGGIEVSGPAKKDLADLKKEVPKNDLEGLPVEAREYLGMLEKMQPPPKENDLFDLANSFNPELSSFYQTSHFKVQLEDQRKAVGVYHNRHRVELLQSSLAEAQAVYEKLKTDKPSINVLSQLCEDVNWGQARINRLAVGMYLAEKIEQNGKEVDFNDLLSTKGDRLKMLGVEDRTERSEAVKMYLSYKLESQGIGRIIEFSPNETGERATFTFSKETFEGGLISATNTRYFIEKEGKKIKVGVNETQNVKIEPNLDLFTKAIQESSGTYAKLAEHLDLPEGYDAEEVY